VNSAVSPRLFKIAPRQLFELNAAPMLDTLSARVGNQRRRTRVAAPVVPNQFHVGKNKLVHKPTNATFSFDVGHTTFKSINWGRAGWAIIERRKLSKERRDAGCAAVAN
jgi:hypothetical protein